MRQEVAYSGAYVVGLGPKVSEARVLDIIHSHQGFRAFYPESDLMSDEEFIEKYNGIIQIPGRGIVDGDMAGRIEYLRAEYEKLPMKANTRYNRATIRLQTSNGKFHPVPTDELRKIFAGPLERVNRYWVEDVLNVPLGRWSAPVGEKPESTKTKRKYERRSRPAKRGSTKSARTSV